ncbi:MAG: trypsin-like peptidase domain-containing protein [Kistimonas sp.]|nr:trypsin-like peptidase domain-containing protein [Kistimonas sp.]
MRTVLHKFSPLIWPTLIGLMLGIILLAPLQWPPGYKETQEKDSTSVQAPVQSFHQAVSRAAPAVVNVYSLGSRPATAGEPSPPKPASPPRAPVSLGSGVIVSADGYILTNHHVINNAASLVVALADGRETPALVAGRDPETDLAVLKVNMSRLPVAQWADSSTTRVGDIALAIGNPFGLGQTVTQGIISATHRQLRLSTYENFIQTDAAISVGNSGGALVNSAGGLVGISTALLSSDGGNEGLGFAIPSQLARQVLSSIVAHGRVIRGWLGLDLSPLRETAQTTGLLVTAVADKSPAALAGVQAGDVLLRIDGMQALTPRQVMNKEADLKPGVQTSLVLERAGQRFHLEPRVGERPTALPRPNPAAKPVGKAAVTPG